MNEIEFRGKRLDNNEWVYGYYIKNEHMGVEKHIIVTNWAQVYVNSHYIKPNTQGQWIGLKDKNGKKIFKDDIVRILTNEKVGESRHGRGRTSYTTSNYEDVYSIGVVKYGKSKYPYDRVSTYYVDTTNNIKYNTYFYCDKSNDPSTIKNNIINCPIECVKEIEVIGNKYDNPELLEVE